MEQLLFKSIKKVNEFLDPEGLPQEEVVSLRNFVLDSQGAKAITRGGYSAFNTNSAGGGLTSIFDVNDSSGNNYAVGVMGTTLVKSSAGTGTWSAFKTGLTTSKKMRMVNYNGKFYCTNGTDAPFITDLSTNYTLTIAKPAVSGITHTNGTSSGLTANSKYYWRLVYVTNVGEYSIASLPFTHSISTTATTVGATANSTSDTILSVNFANLPISSDSRVVSRLLFRTEANGNVFYLATRLDNTVTTFVDDIPDTSLDLSITYDTITNPSISKYILTHKERLFLFNNTVPKESPEMIYSNIIINAVGIIGLSAGTYYYKMVYVDDKGNVSAPSTAVTVTFTGSKTVILSNLPGRLESTYEQRIYRSTNGTNYYFLGIATQYWFVDTGDPVTAETLPAETSGSTAYNCSVIYSEIGKPGQLNAFNILQIYPDDGDEITGAVDNEDGIKIFKRSSIYKLYTNGAPLNWTIEKIVAQIGCDEPDSLQNIGERVYFRNNKQLFRFPDKINIPVSQNFKTSNNAFTLKDSCYFNYNQWYLMFGTINSVSVALVYDEKLDTFYYFTTSSAVALECGVEKKLGSTKGILLLGSNATNYLLKYDTSITTDNAGSGTTYNIATSIRTKTFTVNEPNSLIRIRLLHADYKKKDSVDVVHLLVNPQDAVQVTSTDSVDSTISSDYKNYKVSTDAMTGSLRTCNKIYYQITNAEEFNGMKLEYRIINRGKR